MDYTIIEKEAFKVMGIRRTTPQVTGTWAIVKEDGSNERIKAISGKYFDLGLCFGFTKDGSNDYMCAIEWEKEPVDGFDIITYPPTVWLVFKAKGTISENIRGNVWARINKDFLPNSKYKKCAATIEHYLIWDEANDKCDIDIWIPVEER